ncbi:hypothetical protein GCM10023166_06910 [Paeniglutamicibacter cryotolerans]
MVLRRDGVCADAGMVLDLPSSLVTNRAPVLIYAARITIEISQGFPIRDP